MKQYRLNAFNKADALVFVLFVAFLLALWLKLKYPSMVFFKWAYYALEAALVGGIADWFAVTALFKRPLGISFHTNLIQQNKEKLAKGCGVLVQEELLSKSGLEAKLQEARFTDIALAKLDDPEIKAKLEGLILDYVENKLRKMDTEAVAASLEQTAKDYLHGLELPELARQIVCGKLQAGYGAVLYEILIKKLAAYIQEPQVKAQLEALVEAKIDAYKREHRMASVLSSLADSLFGGLFGAKKILDSKDMAEGVYVELQHTVEQLYTYEPLRSWFLAELNRALYGVANSQQWQVLLKELQDNTVNHLSLKQPLKLMLEQMLGELCRPPYRPENVAGDSYALAHIMDTGEKLVVPTILARTIDSGFELIIDCLKNNTPYRERLEQLLEMLAMSCFTHTHSLLGQMVELILQKMDAQELNELIYSKVEEDMLWIRYNGSIIGGILGLAYGIILG